MSDQSCFQATLLKAFCFSSLLVFASGCTTNTANNTTSSSQNTPAEKASHITALNLSSLQSLDAIMPQLAAHKTVLVGETHTRYGDHLNQFAVIKGLHKQWGAKLSIGLEMIQQPYQRYLDDYTAGKIGEHAMLRGTQWYDRWRYDFRLYRPIFSYAKQNKIPLVALNIPKELTKRISKVGIKGLNKKERSQLPQTLDKSNPAYIKRLKSVFNDHSRASSKGFDNFMEAQLAWDEGMAWHAANFLQTHPASRMVILAGGGHLINREGIPDRLERRIHSKPAVILNSVNDTPSSIQGDYLLFSPEVKLDAVGRIGIAMKDSKKGVAIASLLRHGAATKAGLAKGDIIQRLDNMPIKTTTDVKLWALNKKPGDQVTAIIQRKQSSKTYKIILEKKIPALNMHNMKAVHGK